MSQQLKKILYDKRMTDTGTGETIAEWKLNTWKAFFALIAIIIALIVLYGLFFTGDGSGDFFGNAIFYAIIIVAVIAGLWLTAQTALKFKKRLQGFIIAFILILTFYWALGVGLTYLGVLPFHMGGYALWILISILAGMGAKRIDGNLDKNDLGYGLLVFVVIIGANIPITETGGFLAMLDAVIFARVAEVLSMIF